MDIIFYAPVSNASVNRLSRTIEEVIPKENIEIYKNIPSLSRRLLKPNKDFTVSVLYAASQEDFADLLSIGELFFSAWIIVILPDNEPGTIAKGHLLRARLLNFQDSDFFEIKAVLGNLYKKTLPINRFA